MPFQGSFIRNANKVLKKMGYLKQSLKPLKIKILNWILKLADSV
ncbi:hypothetical protein SAMN02982997_02274 [Legionella micdadei]|uniref:Transposase n=1 Tax=Legionella micdadei TaxID=451 RepID=A0A1G5HE86_LEGMI|nr:hypothetical protein SAMN02982997_02274 [Legionella micdadei]